MSYSDSHAHVHDTQFDADRRDVIARAHAAGVTAIVTVGTNRATSARAMATAHANDGVWATVGMHPLHVAKAAHAVPEEQVVEIFDKDFYLSLAQDAKVVAIGEVGLDYHHFGEDDDVAAMQEAQRRVLRGFVEVCNMARKPIVIHCWDAYADVLDIVTRYPVEKKGIIHSFVSGWKTAKQFVDAGYTIGVNGIVTYGDSYDKLLRMMPLERLVIETDCPYLPPRPLPRELRCEPKDVVLVAQKIAAVRGIAVEEVARVTTENARRIFGI